MSDSKQKQFLRKTIHNFWCHSKRVSILLGFCYILLGPVFEFRHNAIYSLTSASLFLATTLRISKDCNCDIMLDYTAGNRPRRITFVFLLANFLVFGALNITVAMTSSLIPISLFGIWLILAAVTGLTEKAFETERISNLSKRSFQEISNLIDLQLLLGDLKRADEASKILKEKAENMSA